MLWTGWFKASAALLPGGGGRGGGAGWLAIPSGRLVGGRTVEPPDRGFSPCCCCCVAAVEAAGMANMSPCRLPVGRPPVLAASEVDVARGVPFGRLVVMVGLLVSGAGLCGRLSCC